MKEWQNMKLIVKVNGKEYKIIEIPCKQNKLSIDIMP